MLTLASVSYIFRAFIGGAVTFIKGVMTFINKAVIFIGKGNSAIKGLFKIAKAKVNRRDLKRQLIIYKLKSPLLLINSLIFISDCFVGLSLQITLYRTYSTNLLFLLKTHTLLYWSSCLSLLSIDLLAFLNIYILKLLKFF